MFFGLINYSIQKGITDIYEDNNYKKYILLKDSKFYNGKDSHSDININLNINLLKNKLNYIMDLSTVLQNQTNNSQ